jgi:hypothetical protein
MAILRGGRRIFGQDIRIGIPRDKTLTTGGILKRYGELPGKSYSSSETTIGRFAGQMAQGEGFARPTRFLVRIFAPNKLKIDDSGSRDENTSVSASVQGVNSIGGQELARNVGMMCRSVQMPSRDINSKDFITYGPRRQMPYAYNFEGKVQLSVYGDKYLRQRMFFETWQKMIFDLNTHNMRYYDDYTGEVDILQLGSNKSENDRDRITYAVRLYECYPQTIGTYDYNYGSQNEVVNLPITLSFRNWKNLGIDQISNFTVGKSFSTLPEVTPDPGFGGIVGGLLNKLPPELKRAGRDFTDGLRRRLPTGRITGGRVFPPFG